MRKPLLVGGVGLSFTLWLWSSLEHSLEQASEYGTLGLLVAGAGTWWWQQRRRTAEGAPAAPQLPLEPADLETAIATAEAAIAKLEAEGGTLPDGRDRLAALEATLERNNLTVAAIGRRGTGKTRLLATLDLPTGADVLEIDLDAPFDPLEVASDLTVFLVEGDLGEAEFQALQQLHEARHRLLLVLNKSDRYLPEELAVLQQSLQQRVAAFIPLADAAIATAADPGPLKVRRELADGTAEETQDAQSPAVADLQARIEFATANPEDLYLAAAWRQARAVAATARHRLNARRRERALPIIERYQWLSAAAAFANPVGTLDLLATSAVSAQLALDLGEIYQQKLSLAQGGAIASALGQQLVQLGIVELSTQAIGGMLKSHALTYVAGGAVQGVSAAYLTRLAGLSLIESFAALPENAGGELPLATLQQKLQAVLAATKRSSLLESLLAQARERLPLTRSASVAS